ncbi:MAG: hypothetical protein U0R69_11230 [Gaiellales bacterium]
MSPRAAVLAAVAATAAVALALVGVAVLDVEDAARSADAPLAFGAGSRDAEVRDPSTGDRIGEAILGIGDDRDYRDAVALTRAAGVPGQSSVRVLELRAEAQTILVPIVGGDGSRELRSAAANLLGVLLFEDAKLADNPRRYLEQSLGAFQDAVRLNPANDVAKRNLELLVGVTVARIVQSTGTAGTEASASPPAEGGY